MSKYINLLPIRGYGAMINIIEAPRGVGKTFTAKLWLIKRFLKCGKKFIWVRRTEEETKTAKKSFFAKKKLLKMLGLSKDDVRVKGDYGYIKRGRKWVDCVEFCSLATVARQRSNDDDDYDVMIVDEAFATPALVNAFRGDEVAAFVDLYISKKREHKMQVFLFGNKELINNPYYQYWNITPPPQGFNGIRRFQNGTLLVCTLSKYVKNDDTDKMQDLLRGTAYYGYMYEGAAKTQCVAKYANKPKRARYYAGFDFGVPFAVWRSNGSYYVRGGVDTCRAVFIERRLIGKYSHEIITSRTDKARFYALEAALKRGKVFYTDPLINEASSGVFERLGLIK